jgi:indolepyruvate ferredoxin oxidoreductase
MGDSIATNLFMVGYAYQRGLLPLSEASILKAIELNGAAIESNKQSFNWGRLAAVDGARVAAAAVPPADKPESQRLSQSLDEVIERRVKFLTDYQDAAYARRYGDFVAKVRAVEAAKQPGATDLTEAVARYYFKLLAIKDEYEVARLYAETDFLKRVEAQFEGSYTLNFWLAPPTTNKPGAKTGEAKKRATVRG